VGFLQPDGRGRRLFRRDALTEDAPVIIVHSLAHAVAGLSAAAEAGRPVTLLSAPDAGISAGPGWFGALVAAAREAAPAARYTALLDCGEDAGAAQAAIRAGIEGVIFTGRADLAERLADIAAQARVTLLIARPVPVLNLAAEFFATPEFLRQRVADVLASLPPV
jgi:delta 1-pyrroline-5-carboxylate dehydrogenase